MKVIKYTGYALHDISELNVSCCSLMKISLRFSYGNVLRLINMLINIIIIIIIIVTSTARRRLYPVRLDNDEQDTWEAFPHPL